ncbi:hypothetical protein AMR42_06890 [Limnothrix sp. PR1529]|nr:hypothetical protein BCR12_03430 [Limnothrix sp. P13C2]PIB14290.1 hypothetical protein AMR42_06890 [Limnothrix sp. PR1529]
MSWSAYQSAAEVDRGAIVGLDSRGSMDKVIPPHQIWARDAAAIPKHRLAQTQHWVAGRGQISQRPDFQLGRTTERLTLGKATELGPILLNRRQFVKR